MATLLLPPIASTFSVSNRRRVRVYAKQAWADNWQLMEYLQPISVTLAASPGVCHATFRYHAGLIKREDKTTFTTDIELAINGWFIKVVLVPLSGGTSEILFLGRISCEEQDIWGVTENLEAHPVDQLYTAYGLETLLDRMPVASSYCLNKAGNGASFSGTATPFDIDLALEFNERFGVGINQFGNRSTIEKTSPGGRSSYVFAGKQAGGTASDPASWSAYDIVKYLYAWYVPDWFTIAIGTPNQPLFDANVWDALNGLVLRYSPRGKTVKQIFDELINRQQGLGWWLKPVKPGDGTGDDTLAGETFKLDVFSIVGTAVTVDDKTLQANANQVIVPTYTDVNQAVTYAVDELTRYGRIRIIGDRIVSCFTVSFEDSTLEKVWTSDEESQYKSVAGTSAHEKDTARQADKFAHVFTAFRIPRTWDWQAGDGEGGDKHLVNPQTSWADARLDYSGASTAVCRDFGHRLMRSLPLRKQQLKEDAEPEFRDLFAVIKDPDDKWQMLHRIERQGKDFPCGLIRPLDTEMGIQVSINPNHLLAKDSWDWTPTDSTADKSMAMDYRKIAATVAVQTDQRLILEVDLNPDDQVLGKIKVIEVPEATMWLVLPGTIVDVNADGTLNHYSGTTIVRDDGSRLRQIGALAEAFYGVPRATLTLQILDIYTVLPIGFYVAQLRSDEAGTLDKTINTPVTEVSFNLEEMSTSIQTSFAELDVKMRNREVDPLAGALKVGRGYSPWHGRGGHRQ